MCIEQIIDAVTWDNFKSAISTKCWKILPNEIYRDCVTAVVTAFVTITISDSVFLFITHIKNIYKTE